MNLSEKKLDFLPLNLESWPLLEKLFGNNGACGGCWCMTWRLSSKEYEKNKGSNNKRILKQLVRAREPLGIIALLDHEPIGWCSIAPRLSFSRLASSKLFKPLDDLPVWSISCLFIKKECRRKNFSSQLIKKAADFAFHNGATMVESYPLISKGKNIPDVFAWTGIEKSFQKAGFKTVHQPNENRLIMRKSIKNES
jgi:GNAT superfamily N-acetyltransferase